MKSFFENIKDTDLFRALRRGLMMSFPIILVGCFACILGNLPIPGYAQWLSEFGNGFLKDFFNLINNCCVGCVALWMMIFISYCYGELVDRQSAIYYSIATLCSYFIIVFEPTSLEQLIARFGSRWTLTALIVTLLSCMLFKKFLKLGEKGSFHIYSTGADNTFVTVLKHLKPIGFVIVAMGIIRCLIQLAFNGVDYYNFGSSIAMALFSKIDNGFFAGFLFLLIVHFLWFFGIHGSNMLENVGLMYQDDMVSGAIFTKTFSDVFVLMGGCGVTLCLIIALLAVGKNQRSKSLARLSIGPGLFNINETVIYGLPIFFNGTFLIPFLLTPLINYTISYGAVALGIVPIVNQAVTWQMPIFFSGYMATGSIAGSLLQAFNLAVGTLVYIPFVKKMERNQEAELKSQIEEAVSYIKTCEENGDMSQLLQNQGSVGETAAALSDDLRYSIKTRQNNIEVFYQPQVYHDGTLAGCEALLRWNHPIGGYIYPPLIIGLAYELKLLDELEYIVIDESCETLAKMASSCKYPMKMSVNISTKQLDNPDFVPAVKDIISKYDFGQCTLVFELTERASLNKKELSNRQLAELRELGIELSLDDFGMGHSSLMYVQNHAFKYVKLDGCITREVTENASSRKIVDSMVKFAKDTDIILIAEYVETMEQVEVLSKIGCNCYQGYYYSKPLTEEDWFKYCRDNDAAQ